MRRTAGQTLPAAVGATHLALDVRAPRGHRADEQCRRACAAAAGGVRKKSYGPRSERGRAFMQWVETARKQARSVGVPASGGGSEDALGGVSEAAGAGAVRPRRRGGGRNGMVMPLGTPFVRRWAIRSMDTPPGW
jgi:hypothetical protein